MHTKQSKFQLGKQGLTEGVLEALKTHFKNRKQVRVSVLKSCCRNREELESLAKQIQDALPFATKCRVLGYTIILLKQSQKTKK